jgi:hypothetical protein
MWYLILIDHYTPRKSACLSIHLSVCLSGPTSKSFVRFPPNFVEFKIIQNQDNVSEWNDKRVGLVQSKHHLIDL